MSFWHTLYISTFAENCSVDNVSILIGYEPANLTVHPSPPNKRSRLDLFFSIGVLCHQKFFYKEKVNFVGDIHKNKLFDNIE